MFHFKLISANGISKHKITSYVQIIPKNNDGKNNSEPYAVTQTISKKSDLQFNEEFTLPFYCFNAINLLFWEKKLGKVKTFASAKIPLTLETFLKHQPQTKDIELFEPFKNASPTVEFSVSYLPYIPLTMRQPINPQKVYVYLTYDPPLQHDTQSVYLMCRGLDNLGTIYDPSKNFQRTEDDELKKCGPTGLTEIYYIDHSMILEDKYFFYIKSIGYTGKVTLNFSTSPNVVSQDNHNEYSLLDNSSSILVNGSNITLALFPVKLLLSIESVSISLVKIQPEIGIQNVVLPPDYAPKACEGDEFDFLTHYVTEDPNGIAERKIMEIGGKILSSFDQKIESYRFEVTPGKKYSLASSFRYNQIQEKVTGVILSFDAKTSSHLSFNVLSCDEHGAQVKIYSISDNKTDPVYHAGYEKALDNAVENFANVAINFDLIEKSAKFIAFFITSPEIPKVHIRRGGDFINQMTWDQEATCRVLDIKYRKELMCLKLPEKQSPVAVLSILIVRGKKDGEWEVWPCAKYCQPPMPYTRQVVCEKDYQNFLCKFISGGEVNKMFKI